MALVPPSAVNEPAIPPRPGTMDSDLEEEQLQAAEAELEVEADPEVEVTTEDKLVRTVRCGAVQCCAVRCSAVLEQVMKEDRSQMVEEDGARAQTMEEPAGCLGALPALLPLLPLHPLRSLHPFLILHLRQVVRGAGGRDRGPDGGAGGALWGRQVGRLNCLDFKYIFFSATVVSIDKHCAAESKVQTNYCCAIQFYISFCRSSCSPPPTAKASQLWTRSPSSRCIVIYPIILS